MDCWRRRHVSGISTGGHLIPYVAHKRLNLSTPPPAFRLRNSVLLGELDRIYNRPRPHLSSVPTEDFLNSRPLVSFDDETKSIRAQTQALLRRVHAPVPRSSRPLLLSGVVPFQELPLPARITSDPYIQRMVDAGIYKSPVAKDVMNMSYYNEPSRTSIGRGHLACMTYAGGRGYPRRKLLFRDENRDIRDEIKFRSYYDKNRMAAKDRAAANILPTGFASRLLRLTPETDPQRRPIKPYRHTISTPSVSKKKDEEARAKEIDDLEARIQRRKKEKETATPNENEEAGQASEKLKKKAEEDRKLEEERLAEQARIAKARQLEEERQAEEARLAEEAKKAEEARKVEEARKAEEEKRIAEEEAKKAEEARIAEEARKAEEEAKKKSEEEAKKKAEEEAKKKAEEEAKKKEEEEARKAEEERLAEEARLAEEEEEARKAEELRLVEEEAKLEEESRLAEETSNAEEVNSTEEAEPTAESETAIEETEPKPEESPAEEAKVEEEEKTPAEQPKESSEVITEDIVTEVVPNATSEGEDVAEPLVEEPQSPENEDAVAEVLEGADATSEELEEE